MSPLRKYRKGMVITCCMALLLTMLLFFEAITSLFESQDRLPRAVLRRNLTNFCLCYLKLLFPAATPEVTADSGIGLETRTLLQAGTDPALPSLWILQTTRAQSPQQNQDQAPNLGFPLEANSCTDPHRTLSFQTLWCSFPRNLPASSCR